MYRMTVITSYSIHYTKLYELIKVYVTYLHKLLDEHNIHHTIIDNLITKDEKKFEHYSKDDLWTIDYEFNE